MLANVLIIVGAITGILGVLDGLILNENQKRYLTDRFIALWNLLDDARRGSLISFLNRGLVRAMSVLGSALFVAWSFVASFIAGLTITFKTDGYGDFTFPRKPMLSDFLSNWDWFLFAFVGLSVAGLLSNAFLVRLLGKHTRVGFLKASILAIFVYVVGRIALRLISLKWVRLYYPDSFVDVVATIMHVVFSAVGFVIVFPLVVFYAVLALLYGVEFLVRRIAEQPKTPLAAFSGLTTAVGGILKVFA